MKLFSEKEIEKEQEIYLDGINNKDPSNNNGDGIMIKANERHSKIINKIKKELEELELWEYNNVDKRIDKLNEIYEMLK